MCHSLSIFYPVMLSLCILYFFFSSCILMQNKHILHVEPATAKPATRRESELFKNKVIFHVSVWSSDPLAEIVLSSDDIGQGKEPQWLDPQLVLHNSSYWILSDQPPGKLMGYQSKQAVSQVWLKWQWQERKRKKIKNKKKPRAQMLSVLSIIYWSCRAAGAEGTTPPLSLSSCVHTWLLCGKSNNSCLTWSTIVQLRDLWIKACQCRVERERVVAVSLWIHHIHYSNIKWLVWSLNSCSQTYILHNLQDS